VQWGTNFFDPKSTEYRLIVHQRNGILVKRKRKTSKEKCVMRNILLTIEYDGTSFCGWQRQPGKRTVQGELERILSIVCGKPVQINGTSRTDARVHAYGQRANFRGEFGIPTDRIMVAANNLLAGGMNAIDSVGDMRITNVEEKEEAFHARFDAKGKKYIYKIRNCIASAVRVGEFTSGIDVFQKNYCYQIRNPLDFDAMKEAAALIVGTHDFRCFQSSGGEEKKTTVRTVFDLNLTCKEKVLEIPNLEEVVCKDLEIEIIGDGFLYNMVRIITGTLVDVGKGKIHPAAISSIIERKDRHNAGHTAPPQGLYLSEIYFTAIK